MRLYISGQMTGLPEFNFPAFNAAAAQLREAGYEVLSPAEMDVIDFNGEHSLEHFNFWLFRQYMARDVPALLSCDGIATLPNYRRSRGARLETYVARASDMPVHPVAHWLESARG